MCIRPDIIYVVSQAVYDEAINLLETYGPLSNGYHNYCEDQIKSSTTEEVRHHWEMVDDFGLRACCSPLSSIEVNGVITHRDDTAKNMCDDQRTRLVIGDPDTPPHIDGQANIPYKTNTATC